MYKMWEETEKHVQLSKKKLTQMKLIESIVKSDQDFRAEEHLQGNVHRLS